MYKHEIAIEGSYINMIMKKEVLYYEEVFCDLLVIAMLPMVFTVLQVRMLKFNRHTIIPAMHPFFGWSRSVFGAY